MANLPFVSHLFEWNPTKKIHDDPQMMMARYPSDSRLVYEEDLQVFAMASETDWKITVTPNIYIFIYIYIHTYIYINMDHYSSSDLLINITLW